MKRLTKIWCSPDADAGGTPVTEPVEQPTQAEPVKEPELKQMTQEEIDRLVDRAFAKGAKAGKKEAQEANSSAEPDVKAQQEVEAKLQVANARLLQAEIKSQALELGLTVNGAKAAISLADFGDCFDEKGEICPEDVKDALEQFTQEFPEFTASPTPPLYAEGTGTAKISETKLTKRKLNQNRII